MEVTIGVAFHILFRLFSWVYKFYDNVVQHFFIFKSINSCADMAMYSGLPYNIREIQSWPYVIEVNLH